MNNTNYIISSTNLSSIFKKDTHIQYPIFKNGKYLEEYFLNYFETLNSDLGKYVYIDCLWTNVHHDPQFENDKELLNKTLSEKIALYPPDTKFFTVVQWDDGPLLNIPKDTIIFGSCSGTIPLPLIYEDNNNKLFNRSCYIDTHGNCMPKLKFNEKNILCSFVGSLTHTVRNKMKILLENENGFCIHSKSWDPNVKDHEGAHFMEITVNSKFALAPRGYGRSSFRFFEIFLLGSIPIYIYDDIEWLPYMDILNYKDFCISIHESEIDKLPHLLNNITEEQYNVMWTNYNKISHYFTVETMSKYIINKIRTM